MRLCLLGILLNQGSTLVVLNFLLCLLVDSTLTRRSFGWSISKVLQYDSPTVGGQVNVFSLSLGPTRFSLGK
ncbi:hypothetical protein VNO77_18290 [Canavalia gladiata]|uniref:Uncharacterized protein n=1 Tax=Canavalia gladiata TaxID=3824 RepID=A0AAN9LKG1_CANGL